MGNITLNKLFIYLCLFLSLSFFSDNNFSEQSQTQYVKGVVSSKLSINLNNPSEDSYNVVKVVMMKIEYDIICSFETFMHIIAIEAKYFIH